MTPLGTFLVEKFTMKKSDQIYPYKTAKFVEAKKPYVEFWAWSETLNRLIRKRLYSIPGVTPKQIEKNGQNRAREINRLLALGYILDPEEKFELFPEELLPALEKAAAIRLIGSSYQVDKSVRLTMNRLREYLIPKNLDKVPVKKFTRAGVILFLDWLKEHRKVSNRTVNNYRDNLNALFEVMVDREHLDKNPASKIKARRVKGTTHQAFTDRQKNILEDYLKEHDPGIYVFTRLIYHAFLRPIEILRLQIWDIDLVNDTILIIPEKAKNEKQQSVVITDPLHQVLEEYLQKYDPPEHFLLFSKGFVPGEESYHRNRFTERHRKALEDTGLYDGKLTGYSWKHTGVCNAYRAGMDIKSIQAQCRHFSLAETETYLRSLGLRTNDEIRKFKW